jgi:hypothetical protein
MNLIRIRNSRGQEKEDIMRAKERMLFHDYNLVFDLLQESLDSEDVAAAEVITSSLKTLRTLYRDNFQNAHKINSNNLEAFISWILIVTYSKEINKSPLLKSSLYSIFKFLKAISKNNPQEKTTVELIMSTLDKSPQAKRKDGVSRSRIDMILKAKRSLLETNLNLAKKFQKDRRIQVLSNRITFC